MISNPSATAINSILNSQFKAAEAAHKIATFAIEKNEVGSTEFKSQDLIKPILSLKEAEIENSAAVKVLQADNKTKGSLFDATA